MRSVSILVPTLNAGQVLGRCLRSIGEQHYPKELIEIIIADGGSTDNTLEIAQQYTDRIYPNPLKTGEAGKAVALKHATGEIVALIDSDNILPSRDWLLQMTDPFEAEEIVGTEPIEYTYRKEDGYITRYCALMGMNDPLCLFLGNYDRNNTITGKWTEVPVQMEDRGTYIRVTLNKGRLPTMGANGFLVRREDLLRVAAPDYLFDLDAVYDLVSQGKKQFAKVKTGIVHLFSGSVATFARKQRRRIVDYLFYRQAQRRTYPWGAMERRRIICFVVSCVFIVPLLVQSVIGCWRKPDWAWLFHPVACWITLCVYGTEALAGLVRRHGPQPRCQWSQ